MLAGPHARVYHELELSTIQLQKGWEAEEIDGLQEPKEFHSMLWILGEILVDHLKCTFEDVLHDRGYFVFHKTLLKISSALVSP